MKDHYPIARIELADIYSCSRDYAGGFVAEDAWRGMRAGSNFLEICATDATGVYADQ